MRRAIFRGADHAARRRLRTLSQDQELPLAHDGPHFRDYHCSSTNNPLRFSDDRRGRRAGAQGRRNDAALHRSRSPAISVLDNDARYSRRKICWPSCARTRCRVAEEPAWGARPCDEHGDVATASLLENSIDQGERRVSFLFEAGRRDSAEKSLMAVRRQEITSC